MIEHSVHITSDASDLLLFGRVVTTPLLILYNNDINACVIPYASENPIYTLE